jgi:hypothetical protein
MCINIPLSDIIEWLIAIFLGIGGWYVASKSTLIQQKQERYNNLIQEFHQFISDFQLSFLPGLLDQKNNKHIIQQINNHLKFIYWKARDLDGLGIKKRDKIYEKIKKVGEEFNDAALLDIDIENALISGKTNEKIESQKKNFLLLANKFVENCYEISKFN